MNNDYKLNCDCCLENIYSIKCSNSNNCDYSMCKNCINNLQFVTNTNLCPACREEKVEIDFIPNILIELEQQEITEPNVNINHSYINLQFIGNHIINFIKIILYPIYLIFYCIFNVFITYYNFIENLFYIKTFKNKKLKLCLTLLFSVIFIFGILILSRGIYILFFPFVPFVCNMNCILLTTLPALFTFFLLILLLLLILKFLIYCFEPKFINNLE